MFDLFKKQAPAPPDVKTLRDELLHFIKTNLTRLQSGEGKSIQSLQLFVACSEGEKHLYEAALYAAEEGRFKEAVQKLADDFALELPAHWNFEVNFTPNLPAEAVKAPQLDVALFIQTKKKAIRQTATAYLKVLQGEAENEVYTITSESGKINIGREKQVQTRDNFYRINTIAFPAQSENESNKYISREHAHVEWDNATASFLLFADEGGVPPRNKIKVRSQRQKDPVKLQSTATGYSLQEGDQILLGETALLEFRYST